ncbi:C39 family peptidase [Neobacillus sp. PS3-34]|uniref:C39 family peptidase n=1 Tax=Neobacillus sp. PS3-34 TaxID=3070678 RepID=UPI0027E105AD|nr:C39 family peptidase [Neobacillus sp. PS3-34]WML47247.1 C39 family peptidase [Neobacillus sp. PS3-34]
MNTLYLIIAFLVLILLQLIRMLKKSASLLRSAIFSLFIFLMIVSAFIMDNFLPGHAAKAYSTIKNLVYSPAVKTGMFLEDHLQIPIIKIKDRVQLDAPVVRQFPELPRGCEVTSLAMLLGHAGIAVDKLTLAKEVKKDLTPYKIDAGKVYFGNPNNGFVGNMYDFQKPGLGVFHAPISALAEKYLPGRIDDLSGGDFQELKIHLSDGRPVWVITNTTYQKLDESQFQYWNTPSGLLKITYKEHAVLLTGYNKDFVFFNDPLTGEKNKKAPIKDFEESWVQMGRQAITYLPS